MMLFDIHVHMGQYFDDYYTPPRVLRTLKCAGITHFAYSSTSNVVTDDPVFMREEREAMHELSEGRAVALLWVTHIVKFDEDYIGYVDETPVPQPSREEWGKQAFCGVGLDNMCIAANGIVYPCSGWQGMPCGNVREQPIKDIWEKSPQLNKLRKLTKSAIPQCYDCEDRQYCAPCLVRNFNESGGDYTKVAKHFCAASHLNRVIVEGARKKS